MSESPLLVLVGTKAQFIKTAPILRVMDRRGVDYRLIYTGQHSETFDELEAAFETRPADEIMVPRQEADSAPGLLSWALRFVLAAVRRIHRREWYGASFGLVHGDTASTLLSALALRFAGVRVAHVEAGLRSPSLWSPFPEELTRRLVSRIATVHFAPTADCAANLIAAPGRVIETSGNTMRDALRMALERQGQLPARGGAGGYALVSIHRSENLGRRRVLDAIMEHVLETAKVLPVRFVLHPVTRRRLLRTGWFTRLQATPGVTLEARMDYVSFVRQMVGARFLMTDGGSNQEEAAMLGLPTLLMRKETERADGLASGSVELSRLDAGRVRAFVAQYAAGSWPLGAVGAESPSACIVDALLEPCA